MPISIQNSSKPTKPTTQNHQMLNILKIAKQKFGCDKFALIGKSRFDPQRPLVFMHIPKCGGTAFRVALKNAIKPQHHIEFFDSCMSGSGELSTPASKQGVFKSVAEMPHGDLITAHISLETARLRYKTAQKFTLLRVPELRILSHWLFWRSWTDENLFFDDDKAVIPLARQSLEDFLSDERLAFQLDNIAARMLVWPHSHISQDRFIDQDDTNRIFKSALQGLASFDYVDILENPNVAQNLSAWLGKELEIHKINQTAAPPEDLRTPLLDQLTPKAMELIAKLTRIDRMLWNAVVEEKMGSNNIQPIRFAAISQGIANFSRLMQPNASF